ncbi:hypothetical protein AHF37_05230 [Paragonimus kellicotti]|nr:hypothetical protein AHF37_05230 [Paragonimus kellicotti]
MNLFCHNVEAYLNVVPSSSELCNPLLNARLYFVTVTQDFLSARFVRLRFQKLQTLSGDWMAMPNQLDSSVYNRYYYSIRTIKVGGKCLCNSHANRCEQRVVDGVPRAICVCQHNTCGSNCEICCPMFNQQLWRPGRVCEECNCHGKADSCVFNQTVANLRLSKRKDGVFEGGGVCVDCRINVNPDSNCRLCLAGHFNLDVDNPEGCQACYCSGLTNQCDGVSPITALTLERNGLLGVVSYSPAP